MSSSILLASIKTKREVAVLEVAQLFAPRWGLQAVWPIEARSASDGFRKAFLIFGSEEEAMQAKNELDGRATALGPLRLYFSTRNFIHSPHSLHRHERRLSGCDLPRKAYSTSPTAHQRLLTHTHLALSHFTPADLAHPRWKGLCPPKHPVCPLTLVAEGLGQSVCPRVASNFFSLFGQPRAVLLHLKQNYAITFFKRIQKRCSCFESLSAITFLGAKISLFNVGYATIDPTLFRNNSDALLIESKDSPVQEKTSERLVIKNVEKRLKIDQVLELIKVVASLKRFGLIKSTLDEETHSFFAEFETELNAVEAFVILNGFELEGKVLKISFFS